MRWGLLALMILITVALYVADVQVQTRYRLVIGTVEATEEEAEQCYFNLGSGRDAATLALHPEGVPCVRMRELVGATGSLVFVPDP